MTSATVSIVDYDDSHHDDFRRLNLEWIERYFWVEEVDRRILDNPHDEIIAPGGHILVARSGDSTLGVCALIAEEDGSFQLAKMAVTPEAQGRGIGRKLGEAAIAKARAAGASRVELYSNTVMAPAIGLYRALGFVEVPHTEAEHERSNIRMSLTL